MADILQARGQLDEALRIRTDEQLPVYERLGDVRSKAVTQGQIADILQARGQLDEALAMHQQRLPAAEGIHEIGMIAHIKFSLANLRLQRGDHEKGGLQEIFQDLAEAFGISQKLGRPDAIGAIGLLLAQVMAMGGLREEGLKTLEQAEQAFTLLNNSQGIEQVQGLKEILKKKVEP